MGRSSKQQAGENRDQIVQAASGLFAAHGIGAVGIADVMKAAGMTQGGFYKHFDSKEALAAEACTLAFANAARIWRHVAEDARRGGRDGVGAVTSYYLGPKPPEMTCPMISYAPDAASSPGDSALNAAYSAGVRSLFETFRDLSAEGSPDTTEDRVRTQFAAMVGSNMLTRPSQGAGWLHRFRRSMKTNLNPDGEKRPGRAKRRPDR